MTFITGDVEKLATAWPFLPPIPEDTPEVAITRVLDAAVVLHPGSNSIYDQSDTQFAEVHLKSISGASASLEVRVSGTSGVESITAAVVYGEEYTLEENVIRCSAGEPLSLIGLDLVIHPACIVLDNKPLEGFNVEVPSGVEYDGTILGYTTVDLVGMAQSGDNGLVLKPGNNVDITIAGGVPTITVLPGKGTGLVDNPEERFSNCPELAKHPAWGMRSINGLVGNVIIRGIRPVNVEATLDEGSDIITLRISAAPPEEELNP
jgi:hypothetical protein